MNPDLDPVTLVDVTLEAETRRLTGLLTGWALGTAAVGGHLWANGEFVPGRTGGSDLVRDYGRTATMWSAVNLGIATAGRRGRHRDGEQAQPARQARRRRRLRRVLRLNAALDVGYIALGAALMSRPETVSRALADRVGDRRLPGAGGGAAIVVQGVFLFWLDVTAATRLA